MQARRRLAATLTACLALVAVAACERPTPIVTLYSGTTSVYDDAFSFCFEGQDPGKQPGAEGACRFDAERTPKLLRVKPGDEVTVDVDKDLADKGWFVALRAADGRSSRLATQSGHVTSFQPDFSESPTLTVQVQKLEAAKDDARPVGVWQFVVAPG